jgi:hypothetical protein
LTDARLHSSWLLKRSTPIAVSDGPIDARRGKTGEAVRFPLPAPLIEALPAAPKHDAITLCATLRGNPWTLSGFRTSWRPIWQRPPSDFETEVNRRRMKNVKHG